MKTVQINNHKTLGLVTVKFKFESGLVIVDKWSPLQTETVGNYTVEGKDLHTTEIDLQSSHEGETEWQAALTEKLEKGHFLVLLDSGTKTMKRFPLNEIQHIYHPATNDGSYQYVIGGNFGTIGTMDFMIL